MTTHFQDEQPATILHADELPPHDRLLGFFGYPLTYFVPFLIGGVLLQCLLPPPRIGVEVLWEWQPRLIVGLAAILIPIIDMAFFTRRCVKLEMGPRFPPKQVLVAAITGAAVGGLVAWYLNLTLTWSVGIPVFLIIVTWIWSTGVVAAYFAGAVWYTRMRRRREYAEEKGLATY